MRAEHSKQRASSIAANYRFGLRNSNTYRLPYPGLRGSVNHDASKSGVAQETMQNVVRKTSKAMTEQEARQILGVSECTSWEETLQKYESLFENNAKKGSFYLQSKVQKAKERLETAYGTRIHTPS
ncbi:mitochondrial import inner membrane translocase subunit PAM16 like 2 isoform X1 [Cryptomeria japonica]|uniref:mitochondrial import inner membrane translocase subunit PAM16 like 2 isoform X1 n=1 Tax=Cryptomeria japonica TaxID=3369 RepID=UPI0027D9DD44|nr:mitochondrial import inner membrane translocase subunit PAM16 like 2 isoform X1 [Cryptomeria japonica]